MKNGYSDGTHFDFLMYLNNHSILHIFSRTKDTTLCYSILRFEPLNVQNTTTYSTVRYKAGATVTPTSRSMSQPASETFGKESHSTHSSRASAFLMHGFDLFLGALQAVTLLYYRLLLVYEFFPSTLNSRSISRWWLSICRPWYRCHSHGTRPM